MSIKVYKYGLLRPIVNYDLVKSIFYKGFIFRNELIRIEKGRRAALRLLHEDDKNVQLAKDSLLKEEKILETLLSKFKANRIDSRSKIDNPLLKLQLKNCKSNLKFLKVSLREKIKLSKLVSKNDIENINQLANELKASTRKNSGLYWGTYNYIADAMTTSCGKLLLYNKDQKPNDPKFIIYNGEGSLAIQAMIKSAISAIPAIDDKKAVKAVKAVLPLTCDQVFLKNNIYFQIDSINRDIFEKPRSERQKLSRTILKFRIGSDDKKKPIWAEFPMIMHRPLPENGIIKCATVHLRKFGSKEEWTLEITVQEENIKNKIISENDLVLDIGWRKIGDTIRLGKTKDSIGNREEILLDKNTILALKKSQEIKSIRDKNFNILKKEIFDYLNTNNVDLPLKIKESTSYISQWKSQKRAVKLFYIWEKNRFVGDEEIFTKLKEWKYNDFHLYNWEINQNRKSHRRRKEQYRILARKLADKYRYLGIEDFDLSKVAKNKSIEDNSEENETAKGNRQLVSISELKLALINAFGPHRVFKLNPENTTKRCFNCKSLQTVSKETVLHTCLNCKIEWDREDNACDNLFELLCERLGGEQTAGPTRTEENPIEIGKLPLSKRQLYRAEGNKKFNVVRAARKAAANTLKSV